jgi:hypothetical protein
VRVAATVVCVCAGCGRFGFDNVTASGGSADAAVMPDGPPGTLGILDALQCETDVVLRSIPRADELLWVSDASGITVGALLHLDNTHHEIHFYPLSLTAGAVDSAADIRSYMTSDMYGLTVLETTAGYAAAFTDLADTQLHLMVLDAGFAPTSNTALTAMSSTQQPLAISTAGIRLVGTTASGIGLQALDATNAPVGSPTTITGLPADEPSITAIGADFIVGWAAGSDCAFERVSAAGNVLAGPLIVDPPGSTSCGLPVALAIGGGGVVYTMEDTTDMANPVAYAAGGDANLTAATTPVAIGAPDSWIEGVVPNSTSALAAVRTTGDSRVVNVTTAGIATPLGSDFGLSGTDIDAEAVLITTGEVVHARTENGMLQIRKLCR